MPQSFVKDPDAVLDYQVDWSSWLSATSPVDSIVTSSWAAEAGITIDSQSSSSTTATVWLSGGQRGRQYEVRNRIVTAGGRQDDRTIYISVRDR